MSDAPEVPEVSNPFDRRVALTIAMIAVILSFVENLGDNAKTDAIIKTNQASNEWARYQAKSIKGNIVEQNGKLLSFLTDSGNTQALDEVKRLRSEAERYETDKSRIEVEARKLNNEADHKGLINDRCDQAALMLQVAVVLCSVAILSHWKVFWFIGIALGALGAVAGGLAFIM